MNRRSFFSFLAAAPIGLPLSLAAMSSTAATQRVPKFRPYNSFKVAGAGIDSTIQQMRLTNGEIVDVHVRSWNRDQLREMFDAISNGLKDGYRLNDPRGES